MRKWRDKHARASARLSRERGESLPGSNYRGNAGSARKMHPYMRPRKGGGASVPQGRHRRESWGPRFDAGPSE